MVGQAITNNDNEPDGETPGAVVVTSLAGSHGGRFSIPPLPSPASSVLPEMPQAAPRGCGPSCPTETARTAAG